MSIMDVAKGDFIWKSSYKSCLKRNIDVFSLERHVQFSNLDTVSDCTRLDPSSDFSLQRVDRPDTGVSTYISGQ